MSLSKWTYLVLIMALALALAACGGANNSDNTGNSSEAEAETVAEESPAGDAAHGEELFNQVCIACHGEGGAGIEGLGKPFTTSEFIRSQSDTELLEFVKMGRPIGDPANTTGVDMPPKGGNPALTDQDLADIIAYIRTLQE